MSDGAVVVITQWAQVAEQDLKSMISNDWSEVVAQTVDKKEWDLLKHESSDLRTFEDKDIAWYREESHVKNNPLNSTTIIKNMFVKGQDESARASW